jgi:sterol 3beta-glucosyltransferase
MSAEPDLKKRLGRKLTKKRPSGIGPSVTMEIPDKFRDGDDVDEDVTAPKNPALNLNQSVFGMIAAAGSQVDFNARFEAMSSDDEDATEPSSRDDTTEKGNRADMEEANTVRSRLDKHRRKLSEHKLLKSLPNLSIKNLRSKSNLSTERSPGGSRTESPSIQISAEHSRDRPVMSRRLEAEEQMAARPSFELPRRPIQPLGTVDETPSSSLAIRLMEIFEFDKPEEVIEEYPCWLMKSVLLQGYMYITTKHICFYAYLPKKSNVVAKSGYLAKRGHKNPKYNRYWFRLKGDVLSYYNDPSDLYFPHGNIDLRYGISAHVADEKKGRDATHFTVVTHKRNYHFKADSAPSAKEWVKALQKIIFRSHNEGDSVKISLPIENVIDVEDIQVIEFAETCKIRVIDNDETYAIDEYFFSFFSFGKEALNVLKLLVEGSAAKQIPEDYLKPLHDGNNGGSSRNSMSASQADGMRTPPLRIQTPVLGDHVKATLSPTFSPGSEATSPRPSTDIRRSMDLNLFTRKSVDLSRLNDRPDIRRSFSASRSESKKRTSEKQSSSDAPSDSYVHSLDPESSAVEAQSQSEETNGSASQILRGSDHLFSPTIQRSSSASRKRDGDLPPTPHGVSHSPTRISTDTKQHPKPRHAATTGSLDEQAPAAASELSGSGPSLQSLVKAGAYPLQRAAGFAKYLNRHSKTMSTMLATESMGYVEKVSGMWKGGKKHYDEPGASMEDDDEDTDRDGGVHGGGTRDRFRDHFALPGTERLQATYFGYLHRVLPLYGKIYISDRHFSFRSLLPGTRTKLILPLRDIENVTKEKGFRFGYSGLVIVISGHEEIFFEFGQGEVRDDCTVTLLKQIESLRYLHESGVLGLDEKEREEVAVLEHKRLQEARHEGSGSAEHDVGVVVDGIRTDAPPILFDDPRASILNFKPTESLRITCLTIGSRGDVQPYIALCKGLLAEGHRPKIATHIEFKDWVESHGIAFAPVAGDPAELMRICVENGMFTYSFLKEASATFRGWIDSLLSTAWSACQDTDLLIESPSAMAGIHIAEALGIPYFRAFTMPWTRTRAYPHAFAVPERKMGGAYNFLSYVMFENVFWKAIQGQINRWRGKQLGLGRTSLEVMKPNKVPFLYNFSPSVVVPPLDWSDWIRVTGYWFLDEGVGFEPPKELTDFIAKARKDGKKLVYIGFGSIVVSDSAALTRTIVSSVQKADVRCILSKGWSDRLDKKGAETSEVELPDDILQIKAAPHDWLFTQIDAAAHHGGAGTTGASLRAGLPTIIKPFFGDQFFFGSRVEDLGVGIYLRKLNVSLLSRALWEATHGERMVGRARGLGEMIRKVSAEPSAMSSTPTFAYICSIY